MTNKEIIEGLEIVKSECGKYLDEGFAWICRPIDAAIKALECEECKDAISRHKAKEIDFDRICVTVAKPAEMIRQKIDELPSVIPKSGKGEYIPVSALKDEIDKIDDIEVFNGKVYVRVGDVIEILDKHISGKEKE